MLHSCGIFRFHFHRLILFSFLFFIYACSGSKQTTGNSNDFPGEVSDSLVASLERTRCFGVCPYYKFNIYRSGYVLYEGYDHVPNLGKYYTWLPSESLVEMGKQAERSGYFELNNEYRNPHLTDFPTIYIEIRFRGNKKKITHYDADPPANLVEMEKYLDSMFNDQTKWTKHPVQDLKE